MADQQINELTSEASPTTDDLIPLFENASGATRQASISAIVQAGLNGLSAWSNFTPAFTNWTIGTGGSAGTTAKYVQVGKLIVARITTTLGTAGASVGSNVTFNIPVAAPSNILGPDNFFICGDVMFQDTGVNSFFGKVRLNSTTTAQLLIMNSASTYLTATAVDGSTPFGFGAGDGMTILFAYERA